ncbi:hypothetical protein B6I21_09060 [candidate division KSB1 bacterium 4572_119]|nr:MAG: hypothetical protein B6I21_09060 [candidate division KSB1 bacterium 4572_119]
MLKENYLTPEKTLEIFNTAKNYSGNREFKLNRDRLGLIIVDMQEYFLKEMSHAFVPSAFKLIGKIIQLINTCKRFNIPIIFTKHINTKSNAGQMKRWWKNVIEKEDPLSEIHHMLDTNNCTIIEKTQYDPFYKTDLEKILNSQKVEQIIVCGVMTNLCCETVVRSSFVRGYEPFLPIDLTAAYNYAFHLSTIINLSFGFSVPSLSDQIFQAIEK